MDVLRFRKELIAWGQQHFRPFPWRLTRDPYHILMAEVMLHRTQALQVQEVYQKFIRCYPNVETLAQAPCEELESNLYSLGLRWRIKLIENLASEIVRRFDGHVPQSKEDLASLPGVSDYISSAVRCFAWNLAEPLVDTNTVRVVGRVYGFEIQESSRRNRRFRNLITGLVDHHEPRAYNYALLDLADKICTKKQAPAHKACPILDFCVSGELTLSKEMERRGEARVQSK
jgi:A/G-specific adenine glycosylase